MMYVPKFPAFPCTSPARLADGNAVMRRRFLLALAIWIAFGLVFLPGGKAQADISMENVKELIRIATCADVRGCRRSSKGRSDCKSYRSTNSPGKEMPALIAAIN